MTRPVMPVWSDSLFRLGAFAAAAIAFGSLAGAMAWVRSPASDDVGEPIDQPVEFDHRHHVRDDGIECEYCHSDVRRSPVAGVPATSVCMGCHAQIWNESPLLAPVRESYATGIPIRWRRVNSVPDFVYFDHRVHVTRGVGCESCHGRVDLMARVRKVQILSMQFCLDCHRDPEPSLRPPERATEMGFSMPAREQAALARELAVDPPTYCSGCHR
jgi:DNA-directed RNA polymerase subunit RPC12/RpoP